MKIEADVQKKLKDFKLDIRFVADNSHIGILGPSGSGKSMFLKNLSGLVKPDSGSISIDNKLMYDKVKKINLDPARRHIGYLFQNYALFPNMTVEENIKAAIYAASKMKKVNSDMKSAEELMELLDISSVAKHRPSEISGGQQQRTALARILASDPELLLLDEPFSALDSFLRERTRLELYDLLVSMNKSFILVSHDRDEIYQMCDHLILFKEGKVIGQGSTEEVFKNPGNVAAAKLTGCKNISRIKRLTEHRFIALDWGNIELVTSKILDEKSEYAGIRAHDFEPCSDSIINNHDANGYQHNENVNELNIIPCDKVSVTKLPFEWYILLENGLWWKKNKSLYDRDEKVSIPEKLRIDPDKIIILRGN